MNGVTVLVASETHFVRGTDGCIRSPSGVDGYAFWKRYLDVFDRVVVAARTGEVSDVPAGQVVEGAGVEVAALPDYRGPLGYLRARRPLGAALADAITSADVLCLRAPGPIAAAAWHRRGARPTGVEVVGDPNDSLGRGAAESPLRPVARVLLVRQLGAMTRRATAVSYVTSGALQRRYPAGGWSTSYSSIDLGDEAFVRPDVVGMRSYARCGTPARPWRLVSVGTLAQPYKGHDVLVAALARCRARGIALTLTIVGDGQHRAALEAQAQALGMTAHVRFAGQVTAGPEVRRELDTADLFVLASRQEGLPRAMIEAMARGIPCVGTRVGGIPELLPAERIVPAGDVDALATVLKRLCAEREALPSLATRDLAVARRYHRDILRLRRVEFYERLRAAVRPARAAASWPLRAAG